MKFNKIVGILLLEFWGGNMNIYLKKKLTIRDLPSYYIVFENYNDILVYEIEYDYIAVRNDITVSDIENDFMLIDEFLNHSLYVERKDVNSDSNVVCCYNNTISLVEYSDVLYFEYDEAYQLGENVTTIYTSEEIKDKLLYRANELFNGTTLETIGEVFDKFAKKENTKLIKNAEKIISKEINMDDKSKYLLNIKDNYNEEDLKINLYKELKLLATIIKDKKTLENASNQVLDAYNYLKKRTK